ncbi:RdgB/HAM1 family non-canonical purine NTP pyrophosphatase [Feifania hominis]
MGKLKEIRDMLAPLQIEVLSMADAGIHAEIEETGTTFEENAMLKAKGVMELSGLPAIADDSGLAVEALDGAPGIYSARYGGEGASDLDRIQKLLHNMEGKDDRRAKFVSALAFAAPDGREFVVRGECHGVLLHEPRGELGFGYDPIFYDETYRQTFGEMDPGLKNSISHRANAMKLFFEEMKKIHATGEQNVNQ